MNLVGSAPSSVLFDSGESRKPSFVPESIPGSAQCSYEPLVTPTIISTLGDPHWDEDNEEMKLTLNSPLLIWNCLSSCLPLVPHHLIFPHHFLILTLIIIF